MIHNHSMIYKEWLKGLFCPCGIFHAFVIDCREQCIFVSMYSVSYKCKMREKDRTDEKQNLKSTNR